MTPLQTPRSTELFGSCVLGQLHPRIISAVRRFGLLDLANRADDARTRRRIEDVLDCPDQRLIPRVPDAGELREDLQVMHNGLLVAADGYYGRFITEMLERSRGVHEPQEELVFQAVLPALRPGATFVELGAYWGFYSMWFMRATPEGRCFLVEPDAAAFEVGQRNFKINRIAGDFTRALVGRAAGVGIGGVPIVTVDSFRREKGIDHIDVLHADIQKAELDMLAGARETIAAEAVDWWFISTHSNRLHQECVDVLRGHGLVIVASADRDQSYSEDGVIVAKRRGVRGPEAVEISRRRTLRGLLRSKLPIVGRLT